jgi:diaminohydroxyphosphoribosylaminopyrimidine deaminase/5-amino-6-(5-phosphoribosylamino)uracil reductase
MLDKEKFMMMALKLAKRAEDKTYPNPMVGAVIVKNGKVIAKGYHRLAGSDHAEVDAIKNASENVRGAELYVTLEPCDHYGRTPPCTKAIIESGIKKVYIAMIDPNPMTKGKGTRRLRSAGIKVEVGVLEKEAEAFNGKYVKFVTKGLPYITAKIAQSLDGKTAAGDGTSKWITSDISRAQVRKMRDRFDAVMVGIGTVKKDDPNLMGAGLRRKPARIVVDSRLSIPLNADLIGTSGKSPLFIGTTGTAPESKRRALGNIPGVHVITVKGRGNRVPLRPFLRELARLGIVNILVEGGGELLGSLFDAGLVDEWIFFIAPKVIGGDKCSVKGVGIPDISRILALKDVSVKRSGEDVVIRGFSCSAGSSRK